MTESKSDWTESEVGQVRKLLDSYSSFQTLIIIEIKWYDISWYEVELLLNLRVC